MRQFPSFRRIESRAPGFPVGFPKATVSRHRVHGYRESTRADRHFIVPPADSLPIPVRVASTQPGRLGSLVRTRCAQISIMIYHVFAILSLELLEILFTSPRPGAKSQEFSATLPNAADREGLAPGGPEAVGPPFGRTYLPACPAINLWGSFPVVAEAVLKRIRGRPGHGRDSG